MKKNIWIIGAVCLLSLMLTACQSAGTGIESASETPFYTVTIDGDKVYYTKDDAEVSKAIDTATQFIQAAISKDYRANDNALEFGFYTEEKRKSYEEQGAIERIKSNVTENQIVQGLEEMEIQNIDFYTLKGIKSCSAQVRYIAVITHGIPAYFEKTSLKPDTKYGRVMTLMMTEQNGSWYIENYSLSQREEVK